jgi:hypothetical protein
MLLRLENVPIWGLQWLLRPLEALVFPDTFLIPAQSKKGGFLCLDELFLSLDCSWLRSILS